MTRSQGLSVFVALFVALSTATSGRAQNQVLRPDAEVDRIERKAELAMQSRRTVDPFAKYGITTSSDNGGADAALRDFRSRQQFASRNDGMGNSAAMYAGTPRYDAVLGQRVGRDPLNNSAFAARAHRAPLLRPCVVGADLCPNQPSATVVAPSTSPRPTCGSAPRARSAAATMSCPPPRSMPTRSQRPPRRGRTVTATRRAAGHVHGRGDCTTDNSVRIFSSSNPFAPFCAGQHSEPTESVQPPEGGNVIRIISPRRLSQTLRVEG